VSTVGETRDEAGAPTPGPGRPMPTINEEEGNQ
jgi:hypothetical protein